MRSSTISNCAAGVLLLLAQFAFGEPPATHIYELDLKPGQRVADFLPKSGDFAASACRAVGEEGRVYLISLSEDVASPLCKNVFVEVLRSRKFPAPELHSDSDDPGWVYPYFISRSPIESFIASEPLDLIWMSDRYLEIHSEQFGMPDGAKVNVSLLNALKPGGELVVEDDVDVAKRIKSEMAIAGFEFVKEQVRSKDARTLLKFRKPG